MRSCSAWMHVQNVGPNSFSRRITDTHIRDAWRRVGDCDEIVIHKKLKTLVAVTDGGRESVRNLKNSKTPHTSQLFAFAAAHSKNNISFNPRSANPVEEYVQHEAQSMSVIRSLIRTDFYPRETAGERERRKRKKYYKCVSDERKNVKPNIKILSLCFLFGVCSIYVCL